MTKLTSNLPSIEGLKTIENKSFGKERALYNSKDLLLKNVSFKGKEDGESALKESSSLVIDSCSFELRYPLWHVKNSTIINSKFLDTCRAPLWYDNNIEIINSSFLGVKIFRECSNIDIIDTKIVSDEPFWNCSNILIKNSNIEGYYAFLNSRNIELSKVNYKGKYSFQYVRNLLIKDSTLDTKDAFWHAKNVHIKNSTIKGEYLGWYASNITFENCIIESHQPLCYAKNIKLINCKMPNSDLAFEYTTAKGNIIGNIDSIKNPLKGKIVVDSVGELIQQDSKYKCTAKVIVKK